MQRGSGRAGSEWRRADLQVPHRELKVLQCARSAPVVGVAEERIEQRDMQHLE